MLGNPADSPSYPMAVLPLSFPIPLCMQGANTCARTEGMYRYKIPFPRPILSPTAIYCFFSELPQQV